MQTSQMNPENVFKNHLEAMGKNDLGKLINDYTEQSEIWTQDGPIVGLEAISAFFTYAFTIFPKDKTSFEIKKLISNETKLYVVLTVDSPMVNIPFGTDSFEIIDGKILWQTSAFQMVQK
jgi:hypothetical protein